MAQVLPQGVHYIDKNKKAPTAVFLENNSRKHTILSLLTLGSVQD